ncbi:hypothetical protein ACWEQ8_10800 [Streptomyces noursei]
MSETSSSDSPSSALQGKRRTPAHFQLSGTALVQNLVASADAVADRSFLGSGLHTSQAPQQAPVVPVPEAAPVTAAVHGPWAHAAVHISHADAKLRSSRWRGYGFRIAPDVLTRLKERVNADRRSTGNSALAIGHYIDAALRHMPEPTAELVAMAEEFGATKLWSSEKPQPSTYRVGEQAYQMVSTLKLVLQEADFCRRGTLVVSAGVERFLDAFDQEGPLQRPDPRRH